MPGTARAVDQTYTTPQSALSFSVSGSDTIDIKIASGGSVEVTDGHGIQTSGGKTTITADGSVTGSSGYSAIAAQTYMGAITISGSGLLDGGVNAETYYGSITLSGTGNITASSGSAASLTISGSGDIEITRSGSFETTSSEADAAAISARNNGTGKVTIRGVGAVTADGGRGISAYTASGAIDVYAAGNVTGAAGIYASTDGSGDVTIGTASGVTVEGKSSTAIYASTQGGKIDIGGSTGLSGEVSGTDGIYADTNGDGTINIKTAAGGTVKARANFIAIQTRSDSDTTIDLGAKVEASAWGYAVDALSRSGTLTIKTASGVEVIGGYIGINAQSYGGSVDVGGAAGLGGVTSGSGFGIYAENMGVGKIDIKTASGSEVKGMSGIGIATKVIDGKTTITIGSGSTVTGTTAAIRAQSYTGAVVVENSGTIRGSLVGDLLSK